MLKPNQNFSNLYWIESVHLKNTQSVLKCGGLAEQGVTRDAFVLSKDLPLQSFLQKLPFFLLPTCRWRTGGCYSIVVCWWHEPSSPSPTWGRVSSVPGCCSSVLFQQAWFNVVFNWFRNRNLAKSFVKDYTAVALLQFSLVFSGSLRQGRLQDFHCLSVGCNTVWVQRSHC